MAAIISLIIPTHNRKASLQRTLDALQRQTISPQWMEVLVVADGCTDDTVEMLTCYATLFTLQVISQASQGAATARNCGAAQATGQILLFLDDDIEPMPTLVATHIATHQAHPGHVVIGAYPPVIRSHASLFQSQLQAWWEQKFATLDESGHRFTYHDLLSGNLSLAATLFTQVGGFDESISDCGGEDYELGIRLIKAHIPFIFVADALGYHHVHETTDLKRGFQRARQEGRVDVRIGQRYPELRAYLPIAVINKYPLYHKIILCLLLFHWPLIGNRLTTYLQNRLDNLERAALHDYWQALYHFIYGYWYWRGVADKVDSWQALVQFTHNNEIARSECPAMSKLDLSQGITGAAQQVDTERPLALHLYYGQQPIGVVPPQPGAERLRGVHLQALLRNNLAVPCLEAFAIGGAMAGSSKLDRHRLFQSIRAKTLWFGPTKIHHMWYEQYSQWGQLDQKATSGQPLPEHDWARHRKAEYELTWLVTSPAKYHWRLRLYQTLYRWHEPLYQWYTGHGWMWPTKWRERLKQILVNQSKI